MSKRKLCSKNRAANCSSNRAAPLARLWKERATVARLGLAERCWDADMALDVLKLGLILIVLWLVAA